MPCYSVTTTTVEWSDKTSAGLLLKALASLNLSPVMQQWGVITFAGGSYTLSTHSMELEGSNVTERTQALKKQYAGEVAKYAFQKAGWIVQTATVKKTIIMGQ